MSESTPWVCTSCKGCGFKASARTLRALSAAMAEHDRYCRQVDLHSDRTAVEISPMK